MMKLINQPKTFVIALKDHDISDRFLKDCLQSSNSNNWNLEISWGVNGNNITPATWEKENIFPRIDKPTMHKPGVQGCFLSHWKLWNACVELNEPIIILEHDAVILKPWSPLEIYKEVTKLHRHYSSKIARYDSDAGHWTKSGHAYCILPESAKKLINFVKKVGAFEVDVLMGDKVVSVDHINPTWVERQNTYSTTENL